MSCATSCVETLTVESWQHAAADEMRAALSRECVRWSVDLGWDLARDWAAVDPSRRAGLLCGWVVRDVGGRLRGWAFGVDTPTGRQLAAVVADGRQAAEALCATAVSGGVGASTLAFVRTDRVMTVEAWREAGCVVQPYAYLVAPTTKAPASGVTAPWSVSDRDDAAALLARAYADAPGLRPFARRGDTDDFLEYVGALTERPGCGVFSPGASRVVRVDGRLVGVALVTSIGATTAHLAQLAVCPSARGQGLGRQLVAEVRRTADAVLCASRISLLVSTANASALHVYAAAGFRQIGRAHV